MLRGYLALAILFTGLFLSDLFQRFLVTPYVRLRPSRRIPALGRWIQTMAWFVTKVPMRIGGAKMPLPDRVVPAAPGQLILMNHQSVFDIPMMVQVVAGGYPRIVTRKRYSRFIPLISHMVRLYQYPVVDPTASRDELREALKSLEDAARSSDVPIGLFPEGTRTRNGEIGPFKVGGLARVLSAREWTVHLFVTDGYWKAAKVKGIAGSLRSIRGTFRYAGSIEWTDPDGDPAALAEEARRRMVEALAELRGETAAA